MGLDRWDFHKIALALGGVIVSWPKKLIGRNKTNKTATKLGLPHKLRTRRDDNRRIIDR